MYCLCIIMLGYMKEGKMRGKINDGRTDSVDGIEKGKVMKLKVKGEGHPITDHEGPEGEQMYSSTLTSTLALDGGV